MTDESEMKVVSLYKFALVADWFADWYCSGCSHHVDVMSLCVGCSSQGKHVGI